MCHSGPLYKIILLENVTDSDCYRLANFGNKYNFINKQCISYPMYKNIGFIVQ